MSGEWSIGQVPDYVGAAQTYRFSADLLGSNDTQFGLRWYLFDRAINVSVPSIVSDEPLAASPEFAKMTFQISPSWPWLSSDNTLRLHMKVSPGFSSVTVQPDTPQRGVTSYELAIGSAGGDESEPRTAVVRLLGAALSRADDGTLARVHVEHVANEAAAEVVLSFDHFNGTLIFDPGPLRGVCGGNVCAVCAVWRATVSDLGVWDIRLFGGCGLQEGEELER